MNCITSIAAAAGRDYIMPEDVGEALLSHEATQVAIDVLEVIGKQTDFGAEDTGLCAFIAWRATQSG
jgi:hypothetical protein